MEADPTAEAVRALLVEFPHCHVTFWWQGQQYLGRVEAVGEETAKVRLYRKRQGRRWKALIYRLLPKRIVEVPFGVLRFTGRTMLALFRDTVIEGRVPPEALAKLRKGPPRASSSNYSPVARSTD